MLILIKKWIWKLKRIGLKKCKRIKLKKWKRRRIHSNKLRISFETQTTKDWNPNLPRFRLQKKHKEGVKKNNDEIVKCNGSVWGKKEKFKHPYPFKHMITKNGNSCRTLKLSCGKAIIQTKKTNNMMILKLTS